ncbi:hypothetical protein HU200_009797 [Digitaria exilis]|uniref:Uncharacterized protein n=1 Tax=Digitaria exilis TaxID=1010633 RepID=A0A835FLJ4_9POAL|nr:hypothetical protein HU200_009797 [Digitaria exilis]
MSVLNLEAEALDVAKMMEAEAVVAVEGVELVAKVVTKVGAVAVAEARNIGECRILRPVAVLHRLGRGVGIGCLFSWQKPKWFVGHSGEEAATGLSRFLKTVYLISGV